MREYAGNWTKRISTVSMLIALTLTLILSGCVNQLNKKQALVNHLLESAGPQEPGTQVSYVVGEGPQEDSIIASPRGQWAISAEASSSLGGRRGFPGFTAKEATGAPNCWDNWNDPRAWGPATENAGYEWIELKYEFPVYAQGVRIRELAGFCIAMVQLKDTQGHYHVKWKGREKIQKDVAWLILDFPKTSYLTDTVRITLDTTRTAHWWKQIDSVQLVGTARK